MNLIFIDTGFFRRLIENASHNDHRRWQEFHYDRINRKLIPMSILTTPFKFLEVLGISGFRRFMPQYPFVTSDVAFSHSSFAEGVSNQMPLIVKEGRDFYANIPELSRENFKSRIDFMLKERIARNPFAQLLAHDVMVRFFENDGVEETIWNYLAIDDIQGVLSTSRCDERFCMTQLQILHDLMGLYTAGYNISFFRLLRSIWVSLEPRFLKRRIKTIVPMKKETDLADTDYVHLAVCGAVHAGQRMPVTVLTCDDKLQVETRVKICKRLSSLYANDILGDSLGRTELGMPEFIPGRLLICDNKMLSVSTVNVDELGTQIEYPDGAIREEYETIKDRLVAFQN